MGCNGLGGGDGSPRSVVVTVVIGAGEGGAAAAEVVTNATPDPLAAIFLNSTTVLKSQIE